VQALQLFQHSHKLWVAVFGEKHLETVKMQMIIIAILYSYDISYYFIIFIVI